MTHEIEIVIVGALAGDPAKRDLIQKLIDKDQSIRWDWVRVLEATALPNRSDIDRLVNRLRNPREKKITVVKLKILDGKTANRLFSTTASIVLPPVAAKSVDDVVSWIFSAEANLVPRIEWFVNYEEAALLALLSKLIRRKYWNKDQSGHKWLKETKLLNQTPVKDPDRGQIRIKALEILPRLYSAGVLLTKGSSGGATPKEWSINTRFLPAIKTTVISAKFDALAELNEIADLIFSIVDSSDDRTINAFDKIINSSVLDNCRDDRDDDEEVEEDQE